MKGLRKALVLDLQQKGITDQRILDGFLNIPRHWFIEAAFGEWAYKDVPFKIEANQTISQPYTVAIMTQLLQVQKGDKILEIGTGSGYQACILQYLGAKVYTIERQEKLYQTTSAFLQKIGYGSVRTLLGDGYEGSPRFAPFDKIIVTAGATEIPSKLVSQLKIGGQMIIPVGEGEVQYMKLISRLDEQKINVKDCGEFRFVPFLPGINLL